MNDDLSISERSRLVRGLLKLRGLRRGPALLLIGVLLLFWGAVDYLTGVEFSVCVFYLLPVSLATLVFGWRGGLLTALLSVGLLLGTEIAERRVFPFAPTWWNATVRLGYFSLHVSILHLLLTRLDEERHEARYDPLTRAANSRYFEEYAAQELSRARRSGRPLSVAYMDLDNFKQVNDELGHAAGNRLLQRLVARMRAEVRPSDHVARLGGDEFIVLFPETGAAQAGPLVRRLREELLDEMRQGGWPVTFSIGVVTFSRLPETVDALIRRVDDLMYRVKRNGKNAVACEEYGEPASPAAPLGEGI